MSQSVPGTNVPPVSFPGISSGIDYNSIIQKLTSLTLPQNVSLNAQIATLNAANTELIKINNLVTCVQTSLGSLSDPAIFNALRATSSNPAEGSASVIAGGTPVSRNLHDLELDAATATTITNNSGGRPFDRRSWRYSDNSAIAKSYAAVTPTNGTSVSGNGTVTIDGVQVTYNVNIDSVQTILAKIQSAGAAGPATLHSLRHSILRPAKSPSRQRPSRSRSGAPSDSGNILQVFKLSTAQVNNTADSGTVTRPPMSAASTRPRRSIAQRTPVT